MTSCAPKVVQLTDGTMITKKKETRIIHKAMRKAYRSLSKSQRHLFDDVNITVDTLNVSKSAYIGTTIELLMLLL